MSKDAKDLPVPSGPDSGLKSYEMTVGEAGAVLTDVVMTDEAAITEETAVSFSKHPLEKIYEALSIMSMVLFSKNPVYQNPYVDDSSSIIKNVSGNAKLELKKTHILDDPRPSSVELTHGPHRGREFIFMVVHTQGKQHLSFVDYRNPEVVAVVNLGEKFNIEDLKMLWKGFRWISANLLTWDQAETVQPEQLNQLKPPFRIPQALPEAP